MAHFGFYKNQTFRLQAHPDQGNPTINDLYGEGTGSGSAVFSATTIADDVETNKNLDILTTVSSTVDFTNMTVRVEVLSATNTVMVNRTYSSINLTPSATIATPITITTAGTYSVRVTVADSGLVQKYRQVTTTFEVTSPVVVDPDPTFLASMSTVSGATVGQEKSFNITVSSNPVLTNMTVLATVTSPTGLATTKTYSGVTLDGTNRLFSITPQTAGTHTLKVELSKSDGTKIYTKTNAGSFGVSSAPTNSVYAVSSAIVTSPLKAGVQLKIQVTATAPNTTPVNIVCDVYDSTNAKISNQFFTNQVLNPTTVFEFLWTPPAAGAYRIESGIFSSDWSTAHQLAGSVSFTAAAADPPTGGGGGTPTGSYYIQGTKIVDPDGNNFIPHGVNMGSHNANGGLWPDRANDSAFAAYLKSKGCNIIRLVSFGTSAFSYSWKSSGAWAGKTGYAAMRAYFRECVGIYRAQGMVTMIEFHDFTNELGSKESAARSDLAQAWTEVANEFKNESDVWFNIANEPFYNSDTGWTAFHDQYIKIIRNLGANNICVIDAPEAGNDIQYKKGRKAMFDSGMATTLTHYGNILCSMHHYGSYDAWTADVDFRRYIDSMHGAGLALVFGEFGHQWTGDPWPAQHAAGVRHCTTIAKEKGCGALWWAVNFNDYFRLHSDGSDFYPENNNKGYTATGQQFVNYLASSFDQSSVGGGGGTTTPPDTGGGGGTTPDPTGTINNRIAYERPFTPDSPFNIGMPKTGVTFTDDPKIRSYSGWVNYDSYSFPCYATTTSDPMATITDPGHSRTVTCRIPAAAAISSGTDGNLFVLQPDGRTTYEFYQMHKLGTNSYTCGRVEQNDLKSDGLGPQRGVRACEWTLFAGLIRSWEVDPSHPATRAGSTTRSSCPVPARSSTRIRLDGNPKAA